MLDATPDRPEQAQPAAEAPEVARLREELAARESELGELRSRLDAVTRRMQEDLRLAAGVQRAGSALCTAPPGLEVAREFLPFREIGGDYCDLVPLGPGRAALAIGDVMGKGVPAALLAASLRSAVRAQLAAGDAPLPELVSRVNRLFLEITPRGRFASFFLACLDLERGRGEYVNAGHDRPFVVRADGRVEELGVGGTVLGLVPEARYETGEIPLAPDDLYVLFTDGVTDRSNDAGEAYGAERLRQAAVRSRGDSARIALYTLIGELQSFSAGRCPDDDLTLLIAKRL